MHPILLKPITPDIVWDTAYHLHHLWGCLENSTKPRFQMTGINRKEADYRFRGSATPSQQQPVANQDKLTNLGKSHSCKPAQPGPSLLGSNRQLKAGDKNREQQLINHCSKIFAYGDLLTLPDHFNKTNIWSHQKSDKIKLGLQLIRIMTFDSTELVSIFSPIKLSWFESTVVPV